MGSTEQQLIHAEWEAFAICEKQGPSHPGENCKIQRCLDSQRKCHCHSERQEKKSTQQRGGACVPADEEKKTAEYFSASGDDPQRRNHSRWQIPIERVRVFQEP